MEKEVRFLDEGGLKLYDSLIRKYIQERGTVKYGSTEKWNSDRSYVPVEGEVIVYSDYGTVEKDGEIVPVAGMKIGDGKAYLIDLPFIYEDVRDELYQHLEDNIRHITQTERDAWNNKVSVSVDGEELLFL